MEGFPMRAVNQLKSAAIAKLTERGLYPDGLGLYLRVTETGTRSWVYRYYAGGKARDMGLGVAEATAASLKAARDLVAQARQQLTRGIDPIAARVAAASAVSFRQAADQYISEIEHTWTNRRSYDQWKNSLATYAHPVLADLPVSAIDIPLVLQVLKPIWRDKQETADRVRARIEKILDWAAVHGYRTGENPARWQIIKPALPSSKREGDNHAALPRDVLPALFAALRKDGSLGAQALEFLVLTCARLTEAVGARWSEVDLDAAVWTIPAERMKAREEHAVPLCARAVELLRSLPRADDLVFPGVNLAYFWRRFKTQLGSEPAVLAATIHGFRATFKQWAVEEATQYHDMLSEMALAHAVGGDTREHYARNAQAIKRRRPLMDDWADFCQSGSAAKVVPLRRVS
jgi:integrase